MPVPLTYDTAVRRHLRPGERVDWVGRPRQGWAVPPVNPALLVCRLAAGLLLLGWSARVAAAGSTGSPPVPTASVLLVAWLTVRQVVGDRRRRAGTWYAVTDRRLLFVLTAARPESAIGVDFDDILTVTRNRPMRVPASPAAVMVRLKQGDIYLSLSTVMRHQFVDRCVVIDDLDRPAELYRLLCRRCPSAAGTVARRIARRRRNGRPWRRLARGRLWPHRAAAPSPRARP